MSLVPKTDENIGACKCDKLKCPSYSTDCIKSENKKLFCSSDVSKSACTFPQNGCVCSSCPLHYNYSLTAGYYCIHGPADLIG